MESILTSIKKLLGITEEYTHFDTDIIMHINSVFLTLNQLGVGTAAVFAIRDSTAIWADFIPEESNDFEAVKSYMYLKVKLLFDSATLSSAVIESMNKMITEYEVRLNIQAESGTTDGEEV